MGHAQAQTARIELGQRVELDRLARFGTSSGVARYRMPVQSRRLPCRLVGPGTLHVAQQMLDAIGLQSPRVCPTGRTPGCSGATA
jgi:hypothetical protein